MSNVKDQKLISTYGQKVLDSGFHSIPNLILDYQKELNLTDRELLFFIKVTHFFKKKFITDSELKMESSRVTLFRIRKSLIEKGYLELKTLYDQSDNGHIKGIGTCYDWTGLIIALNNLPMFQNETDVSICYADVQNETPSIKMKHIYSNKGKECIVKESKVKECVVTNNGKFIKPSVNEILAYCKERKNSIDPNRFYDHYESNGWCVGKNKMKDWKAAVRTWERNNFNKQEQSSDIPEFSEAG